MTLAETAAFNAGLRHAAALTLELRDDADQVRQRAAIEALRGLAEGLRSAIADAGRQ